MKRLHLTYRGIVQLVEIIPEIRTMLGLETIPHFTTLQKFLQRVPSTWFDTLLHRTVLLFEEGNESGTWIAIDGTGHSSQYASVYYTKRSAPQTERQQRKRYTRNQIAVETESQVIIAHRVARGPRHEAKRKMHSLSSERRKRCTPSATPWTKHTTVRRYGKWW
jgi:hypothetical protein